MSILPGSSTAWTPWDCAYCNVCKQGMCRDTLADSRQRALQGDSFSQHKIHPAAHKHHDLETRCWRPPLKAVSREGLSHTNGLCSAPAMNRQRRGSMGARKGKIRGTELGRVMLEGKGLSWLAGTWLPWAQNPWGHQSQREAPQLPTWASGSSSEGTAAPPAQPCPAPLGGAMGPCPTRWWGSASVHG